jgi:hypothetical protein
MRNLHIDYRGDPLSYQGASLLAKGIARQAMADVSKSASATNTASS